ncbi:unnamed protein product [Miscanthus lutarioriparius]|uniref:Protein kinase domain-containing protein n=1 Tax=Miscanthus lutarioriparius TaxID=422564 RepID=A0A811RGB4_9POAL|nr:unnamed protein product [Miscanthus lutarioriparius]
MASANTASSGGSDEARYPLNVESYRLLCKIGSGVSSVVYKAVCLPLGSSAVVAIKAIDLERSRVDLDGVQREAKAMALLSHRNVLGAHCSFTVGSHLWVVMPFMGVGSLHSILRHGFPGSLPEPAFKDMVSACLCQEPAKRPSAEKLVRHPFFKAYHRRSSDFLVRHGLAVVLSIEDRCSKDDDDAGSDLCGCLDAGGGARCVSLCRRHTDDVVVVKNRRISGWNFNEDNLELIRRPRTRRWRRAAAWGSRSWEGAAEAIGLKEQQQVVTRQLMAVLESLEMQRDMVTHVLQSTAGRFDDIEVDGGNGDACGVNATAPSEEEREEILLGYVRQLEHRVEDLRKEVEEEMAWNARLEKMLQERVIISDDEKKINSSHTSAGYS